MDSIKEVLSKRWKALTQPSLIALRELLLSWEIVACDSNGVVELIIPDPDGEEMGGSFYVFPPPNSDKLNKILGKIDIHENPCFAEFIRYFIGSGESIDGSWGFVGEDDELYSLREIFGDDFEGPDAIKDINSESKRDYDIWKEAIFFYHAGNGDMLFLHPNGKVAWWEFTEFVARPAADSFDDFVELYIEFLANNSLPDSYTGPWKTDPFPDEIDVEY